MAAEEKSVEKGEAAGVVQFKEEKNVWARPSHQKVEMGPFVGLPPSFLYWPFLSLFILFQSLPGSKKKKNLRRGRKRRRMKRRREIKKKREKKNLVKNTLSKGSNTISRAEFSHPLNPPSSSPSGYHPPFAQTYGHYF